MIVANLFVFKKRILCYNIEGIEENGIICGMSCFTACD